MRVYVQGSSTRRQRQVHRSLIFTFLRLTSLGFSACDVGLRSTSLGLKVASLRAMRGLFVVIIPQISHTLSSACLPRMEQLCKSRDVRSTRFGLLNLGSSVLGPIAKES